MLLTTKGTLLTSPKLMKLNYVKGLNYGNRSEPDGDFEDRNAIEAVSEAKRPVTKVEEYNKHPPLEAFKSPLPLALLCVSHYESMITLAFNDRVIIPLWKKWKGQPGTYMNTPQQTDY
ncbi:PREDICTED: NRT1/ PTR FAMILY [Prunus dulcis]|uniref:PREDICTED: NRT1/ PTR FAMILY n=1 Tax=Prunus dulcis TaxID=3755 RepID=A0A5E4E6W8_PRUDU|nr:PREDICTED: NRT1/ PTR FAMILY [Prunus dulcis]